nr:iron-siderophore ABC transporter substrate-binding protein [Nakamurella flavida]
MGTGQLDGLLLLGVVPVGSAKAAKAELVPPYLAQAYPELQPDLAAMADVGLRLEPNLEAVAAVGPDLILSNSAAAEGIYDQLSQIAPTVLAEGTGVNWKQDFPLIADAVGATEQAQAELDAYHQRAVDFGARFEGAAPTVSLVRFTSDQTRVFGVASFAGGIAQDAGLTRPEAQQFAGTSQDVADEQIEVADADWIFAGAQPGTDLAAETAAPLWGTLAAVAAGHVVTVDDDPWYLNAGPTAANEVLEQLISTLSN